MQLSTYMCNAPLESLTYWQYTSWITIIINYNSLLEAERLVNSAIIKLFTVNVLNNNK